ncbi:MAG: hypothetical protein AABY07_09360 [Nanoarchaeota archaeon]
MEKWLIFKIFPKCNGSSDVNTIPKLFELGDKFLPELKVLAKDHICFHAYYSDDEHYPEGPHFKFFVKITDKGSFFEWKKEKEKLRGINKIDIEESNENTELDLCGLAGRIFYEINEKHNLIKLSEALLNNNKFKDLWNKAKTDKNAQTAVHFLCLMLQILSHEENLLYQILNTKLE